LEDGGKINKNQIQESSKVSCTKIFSESKKKIKIVQPKRKMQINHHLGNK
jgi:hypothetical protein